MSKIVMLTKNELIKLFKRRSTIIMLALIVVASLLVMAIYKGAGYMPDIGYMDTGYWWEGEAEWIEESYGKIGADGKYINQTEYAYEMRNRAEMYRYLLSFNETDEPINGTGDWRYPLVEEMFSYRLTLSLKGSISPEEEARYNELKSYVENVIKF